MGTFETCSKSDFLTCGCGGLIHRLVDPARGGKPLATPNQPNHLSTRTAQPESRQQNLLITGVPGRPWTYYSCARTPALEKLTPSCHRCRHTFFPRPASPTESTCTAREVEHVSAASRDTNQRPWRSQLRVYWMMTSFTLNTTSPVLLSTT